MMVKAALEKIEPGFGSSFSYRKFTGHASKPTWHWHPEFEIVYISNGSGKRHVGNHISYYDKGDLIFLGPNMPHFGFVDNIHEEHVEIVVQMREDFLGKQFWSQPEMFNMHLLFERAKQGLSFSGTVKKRVGSILQEMEQLPNFERLLALLKALHLLANSEEYKSLNVTGLAVEVNAQDQYRMRKIYNFVGDNYQRAIPLEEIAGEINMTVPAFCRYFRKLTRKTFTKFVNEFRIAHASKLLAEEHLSIAEICFESGFNNLSHFNKQFRLITGKSPSAYRKTLKKFLQ